MKKVITFIYLFFLITVCIAQDSIALDLSDKIKIATIVEGKPIFVCDTNLLLDAIHKTFGKLAYSNVQIMNTFILGKQEYYLLFFKKLSNKKLVKWLHTEDKNIYLEAIESDKYQSLQLYVSCLGEEQCYPRLMNDNGKLFWSCREIAACVNEETAKKHPCECSKTLIAK